MKAASLLLGKKADPAPGSGKKTLAEALMASVKVVITQYSMMHSFLVTEGSVYRTVAGLRHQGLVAAIGTR